MNSIKLDLGAGSKRHPGYIRVGLQSDHDVVSDLRKLPFPDGFADEAISIHVIEHFYEWDVLPTLIEWRRVLKPGGLLIIELPDLLKCCQAFIKDQGANPQQSLWGIYGKQNREDPLDLHKHGWTPTTLSDVVKKAGFVAIRTCTPQFHGGRVNRDMRIEARVP